MAIMKTTTYRLKTINFTEQEQEILKEIGIKLYNYKELNLNDIESKIIINLLIEVSPDKQGHKDFIMELIKELKR